MTAMEIVNADFQTRELKLMPYLYKIDHTQNMFKSFESVERQN